MRRHDFDAAGREAVLNRLVQERVGVDHALRVPRVGVQLIRHVEVAERPLQDEWRRLAEDARGAERGVNQERVNGPPRGAVADRDLGMKDQPRGLREPRIVHDLHAQDRGVGDRHHLVLDGADLCDEQRRLDDVPLGLANPHAVAHLERAGVREDRAGDHVRNRRARRQRDQQAEEDRHALERRRLRPRDIGERRDERERDHEDAQEVEGRCRPLGREVLQFNRPPPDLREEQPHQRQHDVGGHGNRDEERRVGEVVDEAVPHRADRIGEITDHEVRGRPRPRQQDHHAFESAEDEGKDRDGSRDAHDAAHHRRQPRGHLTRSHVDAGDALDAPRLDLLSSLRVLRRTT